MSFIPSSFMAKFQGLSGADMAKLEAELFNGADEREEPDAFAAYVAAHQTIAVNGWRDLDDREVAQELLDVRSNSKAQKLVDEFAFSILVMEEGRTNLATELFKALPFQAADRFGDAVSYVPFRQEQLNDLLNDIRDTVLRDYAQFLVLGVLRSWARKHPKEALSLLNNPIVIAPTFSRYIAKGLFESGYVDGHSQLGYWRAWLEKGGEHTELSLLLLHQLLAGKLLTPAAALATVETYLFDEDDAVASAAASALGETLLEGVSHEALELLERKIEDRRSYSQHVLSQIFNYSDQPEVIGLRPKFLKSVTALESSNLGTISHVDGILTKLVESDAEAVLEFLKDWVVEHKEESPRDLIRQSRFSGTVSSLRSRRQLVAEYGTVWLTADVPVAKAGAFVLDHFAIDALSTARLASMTEEQVKRTIDRILALHFSQPKQKFKLLHSLAPYCSRPDLMTHLRDAMEESCLNYPGAAQEFADELGDAESATPWREILQDLEATYFKNEERFAILRELMPPANRRQTYARFEQQQQAEANKVIYESSESILLRLAKRVSIGRGDSWVVARSDSRNPSPPSGFVESSFTVELPRLEFIDPDIEAAKRLRRLQQMKPKHETGD